MPTIPVSTPLGYVGVFFVIAGIFLVLSGLSILKIEKLTVATGRRTWGLGLLIATLGILFLLPEIGSALRIPTTPTATALPISSPQPATIIPTETQPPKSMTTPVQETPTISAVSPTPTPTNSPDKIASQLLKEAQNWDLVPNTEFSTDVWEKGPITGNSWSGAITITTTGVYQVALNYLGKGYGGYWIFPTIGEQTDFFLSVDGKYVEDVAGNTYGLMFRLSSTEDPGYLFELYERERIYEIDAYDKDWIPLQNRIPSENIRPGEFNRLSVIAQGPELYFYINDKFVRHLTDNKFSRGIFGLRLFVNEGKTHIYEFNNFVLRIPPK